MTRGIIGFAGFKYCGKDSAAQPLVDMGWQKIQMPGAIKAMMRALFEYQGLTDNEMIERMLEGALKEAPNPYLAGATVRHGLQGLGTEWARLHMPEDMQIQIVLNRAKNFEWVTIVGVRNHNEVALIQQAGGRVYRINRDGCNLGVDLHPNEQQIPFLKVDGDLDNNGTLKELHDKVMRLPF